MPASYCRTGGRPLSAEAREAWLGGSRRALGDFLGQRIATHDGIPSLVNGRGQAGAGPLQHAAQVISLVGLHHAGANGEPTGAGFPRKAAAFHRRSQTLGNGHSVRQQRAGQQQREGVFAQAGNVVHVAHRGVDELRGNAEDDFGGAGPVVAHDSRIAVELDQEQRERRAAAPPLSQTADEIVKKCRPRGNVGNSLAKQELARQEPAQPVRRN